MYAAIFVVEVWDIIVAIRFLGWCIHALHGIVLFGGFLEA
jgi:hypothetical protein